MPVCLGAYSHFEPIMKEQTHLRYLAQLGVAKVIVGCNDPALTPPPGQDRGQKAREEMGLSQNREPGQ